MQIAFAQNPSPSQPGAAGQNANPPAPSPLTTPTITGPLQARSPNTFDAGPFGKLDVNGVLDGLGIWTGNYVAGDDSTHAALGNAQVFIQRTESWFQFYLQAGAYNIPALGVPFLATGDTVNDLYGPVPVAFLKLQPAKNTSILIGALPTLMGAEYTFTISEHERTAWPVVEPGKCRQPRNPGESDDRQIHSGLELERRILFEPLLMDERLVDLCQWAP